MTDAHRKKRLRAERRFRCYGIAAISFSFLVLCLLLGAIVRQGMPGLMETQIRIPVVLQEAETGVLPLDPDYDRMVLDGMKQLFPEAEGRAGVRALSGLYSMAAAEELKRTLEARPQENYFHPVWITASAKADLWHKGKLSNLNEMQERWLLTLKDDGGMKPAFNPYFFSGGDSREPEMAGFLGAISGSLFTLLVCIAVAFPLGVATAVYLEEFAPRRWWTDLIEVNINNLAAIPSIVFGLLGLSVYLITFGLPRSASLVGGLTLALMILPVIIITTRVALKAVPDTIRDAARALGASPLQVVWHHTLPLSLPGIMTGTILGMARAMGETAPLLMIGMVAFVADIPGNFTDPATVMPVQIYLWASNPELSFVEKTGAGIMVLLLILGVMNAFAIFIRKRFEIRW